MGEWRTRTGQWLSHEQSGRDDASDEALAQVFAAVPVLRPSAGFVEQTVAASWMARGRRRQWAAMAAAAVVLLTLSGGAVAYAAWGVAGVWLLTTAAAAVAGSTLFAATVATTVLEWWAAGARIGSAVTAVMAAPQGLAMLAAIELVGAGALYLLHRLLRGDVTWHRPGPLCV